MARFFANWRSAVVLAVFCVGVVVPWGMNWADIPAQLRSRVDAAIVRGRGALLPRLKRLTEAPPSDYPAGRIAIVVTALIKADLPLTQPELMVAFETLGGLEPQKTYCVSCYVFALGALIDRRQATSHTANRTSRSTVVGGRRLESPTGPSHAKMKELIDWLVAAQSRASGGWSYGKTPHLRRYDFSNTQFAMLALQVGHEHGASIPKNVFVASARLFARSIRQEDQTYLFTYRPVSRWESVLGLAPRERERGGRIRPGGWAYRGHKNSSAAGGQAPYAAMTAAGASSLTIARRALGFDVGRRSRGQAAGLARRSQKALHQSYAWIAKHFDRFLVEERGFYYTLYSLEKAGDLGQVESFDKRLWYREGCERIVDRQRADGSWGRYSDIALALLFLTRATRSLDAAAGPTIVTRGPEEKGLAPEEGDLVYVDAAGGFLSAGKLLRYAAETRNPKLVSITRQVVKNYRPSSREDLVPHLLALWGRADRLTRFARQALKSVTGEAYKKKEKYSRWYRDYEAIVELGQKDDLNVSEMTEWLRRTESVQLKMQLIHVVNRRKLAILRSVLLEELKTPSDVYRRLVHGTLRLWTGADIRAPSASVPRAWDRVRAEWRRWLRDHPQKQTHRQNETQRQKLETEFMP